MKEIIDVFRMNELDAKIRARIIIKLGLALNFQFGANVTEALVYELVKILDAENKILTDEFYIRKYNETY